MSALDAVLRAQEEFDPDSVTPGVWGFVVTFAIAGIAILLIIDMVRRVRRTTYRAEIAERLDREEAEARAAAERGEQAHGGGAAAEDGSGERPPAS